MSLMPIIEDSTSGSLRDYVYSEQYIDFGDLGLLTAYEQTSRNVAGYKLIHRPYKPLNRYRLYYLPNDPWEEFDLYDDFSPNLTSEQQANFDDLKAQMESLVTVARRTVKAVSPPRAR